MLCCLRLSAIGRHYKVVDFDVDFTCFVVVSFDADTFPPSICCLSTKKNNQPNIDNHSKQCIFIAPSIPTCKRMIDIKVKCRVHFGQMNIILPHSTTNEAQVRACNGPRRLNIKSGTIGPPKKSFVWMILKNNDKQQKGRGGDKRVQFLFR